MLTLAIASDHGGFDLKQALIRSLSDYRKDISFLDLGTDSEASVDYPDMAQLVVDAIAQGKAEHGILICGTGIGICMAANRHPFIRAALVHSVETAKLAKQHNNANVLCLGGRTTSLTEARKYVEAWLDHQYEEGRHEGRLAKFS